MFLLQFPEKGDMKRNYTVIVDQKNKEGFCINSSLTADMVPTSGSAYENAGKPKLVWFMHIVKAIDKESNSSSDYLYFFSKTTSGDKMLISRLATD
jgi:hypothetical protein